MTQEMKQYELSYLLSPSVQADEVGAKLGAIRAMIEKHEGAILGEDEARLRPLAYEIRKNVANKIVRYTQAHAGSLYFTAPSLAIPEIAAALRVNDLVVRSLLVEFHKDAAEAASGTEEVASVGGEKVSAPTEVPEVQAADEMNQKIDAEIDQLIASNS